MDLTTAFWFAVGIIVLLVLLQVLARPLEVGLKLLASSIVGGLSLWGLNVAGRFVGFHLGLNPVSAVVAGVLGAPGVVGLALMRAILG